MTSRGAALMIGGGAVLAMAIVLVLFLKSGGSEPTSTSAPAAEPPARATAASPSPGPQPGAAPSLPARAPDDPAAGSGSAAYREYMVGDRLVRDHRKGNKPPVDIPPAVHAPSGRLIDAKVTHAVGQKLKAALKECAAALPSDARGTRPRLEGLVNVAIKDKQLTVRSSVVQVRDVAEAQTASVKACFEQKALAVSESADEADLDTYDITVSYAL